jgi:hypothetical protein
MLSASKNITYHTIHIICKQYRIIHVCTAIDHTQCKNISLCFQHKISQDLIMNSYLLDIFLFTKENGVNCNPIYILSTIMTIIIIINIWTYVLNAVFFLPYWFVYRKLTAERTASFKQGVLYFVSISLTIQYMQYIAYNICQNVSKPVNFKEKYS